MKHKLGREKSILSCRRGTRYADSLGLRRVRRNKERKEDNINEKCVPFFILSKIEDFKYLGQRSMMRLGGVIIMKDNLRKVNKRKKEREKRD